MKGLPVPWIYLLAAGFLEIGWVYSLKFTEGFTRLLPTCFYALFGLGAAFFLSLALKHMPVGVTYAIWVGIAVAGSNLVGMFIFGEPCQFLRVFFILMILGGVIGLKVSTMG